VRRLTILSARLVKEDKEEPDREKIANITVLRLAR
jgi:hypothetical protein